MVLYKNYTRTVNTGHQNMILPVELKQDVLEAAQWVKAKGKERIYGSSTPDHYDGLRFDADSTKHNHGVYSIWDKDYYDIEQFMRHHDDKLEPKDIQRSASAAEEKKDETSDTDSTFDESDASTITNNDPKSKARAYVERNKYDNSVKNMYKALRPVACQPLPPPRVQAMLFNPITLPNGAVLKNRLVKAAMEESLARPDRTPSDELIQLYRRWSEGG